MTAQVAADLRAAAEVLKRDGWAQGSFHSGCHHCVQGAIAVVVGRGKAPDPQRWKLLGTTQRRFDRVNLALSEHLKHDYGDWRPTHDWNDAPGRTADEVIAALLAAADAAEATP